MRFIFILVLLLATNLSTAATANNKPTITVANDGFPSSQNTPEGAAADFARAFIQHDSEKIRNISIRVYGGGQAKIDYETFLEQTNADVEAEKRRDIPSPHGPKSIGKVFAARQLSSSGPASYGYAAFGFQDVQFVDVGVHLHNGDRALNRTLVIKDRDGKWYVHPAPHISPLLSRGLNRESASAADFSELFELGHGNADQPIIAPDLSRQAAPVR